MPKKFLEKSSPSKYFKDFPEKIGKKVAEVLQKKLFGKFIKRIIRSILKKCMNPEAIFGGIPDETGGETSEGLPKNFYRNCPENISGKSPSELCPVAKNVRF